MADKKMAMCKRGKSSTLIHQSGDFKKGRNEKSVKVKPSIIRVDFMLILVLV